MSTESILSGRMGTHSLPSTRVRSGHAQGWMQTSKEVPTSGLSPRAGAVLPMIAGGRCQALPGPPGNRPESPTVGGGGQRGPGRAGCQGWEDAEVEMEVSVRAQAQGGKNSCRSCIIKILLSGAWQSPINPHRGSTLNPHSSCSTPLPGHRLGPGSAWGELGARIRLALGRARVGQGGYGEGGQGSGPGLLLGPCIPSVLPSAL